MEKYIIRARQDNPGQFSARTSVHRRSWWRSLFELSGRLDPKHRSYLSSLYIQSYGQVTLFPHAYFDASGRPCETRANENADAPCLRQGVSSIEFDNKGIYLVSVTKSGCLTVHDFENLSNGENADPVLHFSLGKRLDHVCWNPLNQDEIACVSTRSHEASIFDISYDSSQPIQTLKSRRSVLVDGTEVHKGLTSVVFSRADKSRVFAPDTNGLVNVWDRRSAHLPCLTLSTNLRSALNTIQINIENQQVLSSGRNGVVYVWDVRGGKSSSVQSHKQACVLPLHSFKVHSALERIDSLRAQVEIVPKEVHAINFNPLYPFHLAFHLDNGWSGVFDTLASRVTHLHCPLKNSDVDMCLRKPAWLLTHSCYVVGSVSENGVHLLDFHPGLHSPCHVDYREDTRRDLRSGFVGVAEGVTVCAAHPITDTVIAGTKNSSLVMISQQRKPD